MEVSTILQSFGGFTNREFHDPEETQNQTESMEDDVEDERVNYLIPPPHPHRRR